MKKINKTGFIPIVLVVIGALVLLKYVYDIDIVESLAEGRFKEVLDQVYKWGYQGWLKYKDVLIDIWNYAIKAIKSVASK